MDVVLEDDVRRTGPLSLAVAVVFSAGRRHFGGEREREGEIVNEGFARSVRMHSV